MKKLEKDLKDSEEKSAKEGHLHPITQVIREIELAMQEIGFEVADGPELETEFYNFDALNMPQNHPARDMQDTFWVRAPKASNAHLVLRTHTSSIQTRYMQSHKPPFKIIMPGKVFRNEATDATHEAQFYQIDGMYVDKKVSLAELKGTLTHLYKKLLGDEVEIQFRPSYFPFVEPAVEVFAKFRGKWIEMMGAGLVHPNVLKAGGLDPEEWQGFAFGGGIDRILLIKYGIPDIRLLYGGDLRFVNQF